MEKATPMMKQYFEIKEEYPDAILFFRLGDFYEMFYDDAVVASRELEITLTKKSCGLAERAPMCGVPFHSADTYIARLVEKGYKVAICEQAENPKEAKGLVRREVVRIITPGTILDENLLSARGANYLCAALKDAAETSVLFCDASTGHMFATYFASDADGHLLGEEILRNAPVEIIYNLDVHRTPSLVAAIEKTEALSVLYNDLYFAKDYATEAVKEQFGEEMHADLPPMILRAAGALLSYLAKTQKTKPRHLTELSVYTAAQFMEIDRTASSNLELFCAMHDKGKKGSLLGVLDTCKTGMGSRMLRSWLARPLLNTMEIAARQDAIEELTKKADVRERITSALGAVADIERVTGRVVMGSANARDLQKLGASLLALPSIKENAASLSAPLSKAQADAIDTMHTLCDMISRGIVDEPPFSIREGNIIREFYSEELDELRRARDDGGAVIAAIEAEEREKTDIKNLKIRYNKVFGYFIEVSRGQLDKVPAHYIRKQTIANGERYITEKLKEVESVILGASEKIIALENALFTDMCDRIAEAAPRIQKTANAIAILDTLCALTDVAVRNGYVCPVVDMSDKIEIRDGRHPVVERILRDTLFVPNDTTLDTGANRLGIITGPNMAGKSTYMRQIALIVILAQMGSFVPATFCHIGLVDKIFTRIGASDDLSTGRSTFMVEMSEVASILENATPKSLLILDEIGRGTSTYDGLSIAWAVLEHCAVKLKAKTMFATHYHELTQLEEKMEGVVNYNIVAKKRGDDIIFLRKIVRGGTDDSYGIEVAKLAGVPDGVLRRAREILSDIESGEEGVRIRGKNTEMPAPTMQMGFEALGGQEILDELKSIDANTLSPIEALETLFRISQKAKEF